MDLSNIPDCRSPTPPTLLPRCLNHTSFYMVATTAHFLVVRAARCLSSLSGWHSDPLLKAWEIVIAKLSSHSQYRFQGCINLLPSLKTAMWEWDPSSPSKLRWSEFVMELKCKRIAPPLLVLFCLYLFCPTHVTLHGVWGRSMMQSSH